MFQFAFCLSHSVFLMVALQAKKTTGNLTIYFEDVSILDKLDSIYCGIAFFPS